MLDGKAWVVDKSGKGVSAQFIRRAYAALDGKKANATLVVLKECSPSCGST